MKMRPYDKDAPIAYAPGAFPSMELLNARPEAVQGLLYSEQGLRNEGVGELIRRCSEAGKWVEEAPRALERIAGKQNCYAAAVFEKYTDELQNAGLHLCLCGISDMGNLGTILRTALGFGVRDVALIRPAADMFDPRAVRASMGALFSLRAAYFDSFEAYQARHPGRQGYFFRLQNAMPLREAAADVIRPATLVFGSEPSGLTGDLLERDVGVVILHSGDIDSLNLSVAVGIGLYEFIQYGGGIT